MPGAVWFGLKRSLQCKSDKNDVYEYEMSEIVNKNLSNISTAKISSTSTDSNCGCSRSIAHFKDVMIHGSKRHSEEKPPVCSPRSIGSSELLNPITHEVVLNNSTCELKISSGSGSQNHNFVGTVKPGTPGPGRIYVGGRQKQGILGSPIRRTSSSLSRRSSGYGGSKPQSSSRGDNNGALFCHKCGDQFSKWEAVEEHHLSTHAVTELLEGDSSRKIVEIICRTNCTKSTENNSSGIERILKVHNMQKILAQFEEYRELVKIKASKLSKKHPRCLADGNELLRFHGATLECSLGSKGSCSLCSSEKCHVCHILRCGFSTKKDVTNSGIGVFTAATSGRAFESIKAHDDDEDESLVSQRKALIVCRVIAGRVHRPMENVQDMAGQSGFDSLAGKVGLHSNIEELYLLSPKALLPCFVVIYKP